MEWSSTVLVAVVLLSVATHARHAPDAATGEGARAQRHRRRSWGYGYDYPSPPALSDYAPSRNDYDYRQHDLVPQILRLLDEIAAQVRRPAPPPPPPPAPIYVPYPVPYPVPQYCSCAPAQPPATNVSVGPRWPEMDDSNQNWGFVDSDEAAEDGDGSRPISLAPLPPKHRPSHPAPVEHGSSQAGAGAPMSSGSGGQASAASAPTPAPCDVFLLSCCAAAVDDRLSCLQRAGCGASYAAGRGCSAARLRSVLDAYSRAYAPV